MNIFNLQGKHAVVTGGFGKIGPVWVQALVEAGAHVSTVDLPGTQPSDIIRVLAEGEQRVHFYYADVSDKDALLAVHEKMRAEAGLVDILVNNAGIDNPPGVVGKSFRIEDIPDETFKAIFGVNTAGAFLCMQVFGRDMIARKAGSIINIGSLYASVSPDRRFYNHLPNDPPFLKPPAYGASKAALYNLTKYFATHWGPLNVRVNMISPGGIEGGQDPEFKRKFCDRVPLGRMGQKEDLAGPLIFLASDAAQYVTGENIKVDGGFTAW